MAGNGTRTIEIQGKQLMKMTILMIALFFTFTDPIVTAAMQPKGADLNLEWETARTFPLGEKPVDIAHSLDGKYAFVLTESNVVMVYDAAGSLQGRIPVDQGVNSIAIDPMGQFLHLSDSKNNTFSTIAIDYVLKINATGSPTKGKLDAPITIAVFSDFQ
jgi:DNA-binding beta-propeller fold protein YncE